MWQEIVVALIVALAVALLARRYWKTFSGKKDSGVTCSCGCARCDQAPEAASECSDRK